MRVTHSEALRRFGAAAVDGWWAAVLWTAHTLLHAAAVVLALADGGRRGKYLMAFNAFGEISRRQSSSAQKSGLGWRRPRSRACCSSAALLPTVCPLL